MIIWIMHTIYQYWYNKKYSARMEYLIIFRTWYISPHSQDCVDLVHPIEFFLIVRVTDFSRPPRKSITLCISCDFVDIIHLTDFENNVVLSIVNHSFYDVSYCS